MNCRRIISTAAGCSDIIIQNICKNLMCAHKNVSISNSQNKLKIHKKKNMLNKLNNHQKPYFFLRN